MQNWPWTSNDTHFWLNPNKRNWEFWDWWDSELITANETWLWDIVHGSIHQQLGIIEDTWPEIKDWVKSTTLKILEDNVHRRSCNNTPAA